MAKRKRNVLRKVSKQPISKLQRKLWIYCKMLTRKRYANEDGTIDCYTCGTRNITGSNCHTGHLIAKASIGANLKYDLRVLRPQCGVCNLFRGGAGADFLRNMIIREGQEYVDAIFAERALTIKAYPYYEMLIEKYKLMMQDLEAKS